MKGRTILKSIAVSTTASDFLADWNKTHLFNPKQTPHAKFHDAITISNAGRIQSTLRSVKNVVMLMKRKRFYLMPVKYYSK